MPRLGIQKRPPIDLILPLALMMQSTVDIPQKTRVRHPFTPEEDARLVLVMQSAEAGRWSDVVQHFPGRTARQCRERWANYLSPAVWSRPWEPHEDELLVTKINDVGRSWSHIVRYFKGRSESDIKNRWYVHLQYQTVLVDQKLQIVTNSSEWQLPERKRRNRQSISPKENVIRLLLHNDGTVAPPEIPKPTGVCMPKEEPPVDCWDRFMPDEALDEQYAGFARFGFPF
jgi:hypothetical protein